MSILETNNEVDRDLDHQDTTDLVVLTHGVVTATVADTTVENATTATTMTGDITTHLETIPGINNIPVTETPPEAGITAETGTTPGIETTPGTEITLEIHINLTTTTPINMISTKRDGMEIKIVNTMVNLLMNKEDDSVIDIPETGREVTADIAVPGA